MDGLQQQKTTLGSTPVRQEQENEATIHTGSPKLDNRRLGETFPGLTSLNFTCDLRVVGSEFDVNNMKEWIHPTSTNLATFKRCSHHCRPCPTLYDHGVPILWWRIVRSVTKLISSNTGFWNIDSEFTGLQRPSQSPDIDPIAPVCNVAEWEIRAAEESAARAWCCHVSVV